MSYLPSVRFIAPDVCIWLVYAGRGRRQFDVFKKNSAVFLEIPGFDAAQDTFYDDASIRQHLRMSDAVREFASGKTAAAPVRRPTQYSNLPGSGKTPEGKRFNAAVGNISRLYRDAKVGDLVLCPPLGHYDPFLIGEITQPWNVDDTLGLDVFGQEAVPIRKVKWLPTTVGRRDFPVKLAKVLQNQHAISIIDPVFYRDIFRIAYDLFVWNETSKIDIFGPNYSSHDPTETSEAAFIIKYFVAAYAAYESGEISEFNRLAPINAVDKFFDAELLEEFRQNFNSPGKFTCISGRPALALCIAAAIAIVTNGTNVSAAHAAVVKEAQASVQAAQRPDIEKTLGGFLNSLDFDREKEIERDYGKKAKDKIGTTIKRPKK